MKIIHQITAITFFLLGHGLLAGTPQTITFPAIPDRLSNSASFSLSASASSGLTVNYTIVSTTPVVNLAGNQITMNGTEGSVTIRASQSGDATYDPAPDAYQSFAVGLASRQFTKIACGLSHTVAIREDGSLWAWGRNYFGELGNGTVNASNTPIQIGVGAWTQIASGQYHNVAIKSDGTLWAWGRNNIGQLGDGSTTSRLNPVKIGSATDWTFVACGEAHTLAIKANGTLWAWGSNSYGQIGDASWTSRQSPVQIGSLSWRQVACGQNHSVGIQSDGSLWSWGRNNTGQLGNGSISDFETRAPVKVGNDSDWASVSCGSEHTLAIRENHSLWSWGRNYDGQLGDGGLTAQQATPTQVGSGTVWNKIATGATHSLAVQTNGSLWSWGRNDSGQLGNNSLISRNSPEQVVSGNGWTTPFAGNSHSLALKDDGTLWSWGWAQYGQLGYPDAYSGPAIPERASFSHPVTCVSTGRTHSAAIRADGTLWAWGYNASGQVGDGTTLTRSPVQIGQDSNWAKVVCGNERTAAIKSDASLWVWGNRFQYSNYLIPVNEGGTWNDVAVGGSHLAAIKSDGTLWHMAANASTAQVGNANNWSQVSCGNDHTLAIRTDGTLWAWGDNSYGQLGDGSYISRSEPVQVGSSSNWSKISCGGWHNLALTVDGKLWGWGLNGNGQLGVGTLTGRITPIQVGTDSDWAFISAGSWHSHAIKSNGSLWSWGTHSLGVGVNNPFTSPVRVGTGFDWLKVSCGAAASQAITSDGGLWCWSSYDWTSSYLALDASWRPVRVWPAREAQMITFTNPGSGLAVGQPMLLNAVANSGLPVSYTVAGPAMSQDSVITAHSPGQISLTAYHGGDRSWRNATSANQTVTAASSLSLFQSNVTQAGLSGAGALPESIPHQDGVPNLLKYAFNMTLNAPDVRTMQPGGSGGLPNITTSLQDEAVGKFRFEYLRRRFSGLVYMPQKSTNPSDSASWTPLTSSPSIQPVNSMWERLVYEEPYPTATTARCFGRVRITIPP